MNRRNLLQAIAATTSIVAIGSMIPGWLKVLAKQPQSASPANPPTKLKPVTYPNSPPTDSSGLRILASEPTVEIAADGKATISWQTVAPTQGGSIYIGIPDYNQQLEYPIYSQVVKLEEAQPTTTHQGSIDLAQYLKIFAPSYLTQGEGVIAYRLDLPTPKRTNNLFHDRSFRVVKSQGTFRVGVHITEGSFVTQTTKTSAIVWWKTDRAARSELTILGRKPLTSKATDTHHEFKISGLLASKAYQYNAKSQVANDTVISRNYSFKTAPIDGNNFSFAFTCDGRTGALGGGDTAIEGVNAKSAQILAAGIHSKKPEFLIFTGDLISGYTSSEADYRAQLQAWKRVYGSLGHYIPLYTGMGNHESLLDVFADGSRFDKQGDRSAEAVFATEFVNPTNAPPPEAPGLPTYQEAVYSFDYGNSHFCQLNSDYWHSNKSDTAGGNPFGRLLPGQIRWLEADLKAARQRGQKHLFVFVHEPAFPNGGHVQDSLWEGGKKTAGVATRDLFWQIVSDAGVVAVFSGHEHNYSRTAIDRNTPVHIDKTPNPKFRSRVWQVIQGAAGAPFYPQEQTVPWIGGVKKFVAPTWAYTMISVRSNVVKLETYSYTGELLDSANLA
jgi:3',5'-cyclic AMP phosphodiesterase CpdA